MAKKVPKTSKNALIPNKKLWEFAAGGGALGAMRLGGENIQKMPPKPRIRRSHRQGDVAGTCGAG